MSNRTRRFLAVAAAALMLASAAVPSTALAAGSHAENANAGVVFDVIVMRPLGFVTLGLGTGLFVASLPILLVTRPQDIAKPADTLVARPARFLWKDSLGGH